MDTQLWDEVLLEKQLFELIVAICTVLNKYGVKEVPVGGLMRLVGIDDELASDHDDQFLIMNSDFEAQLREIGEELKFTFTDSAVPPGATIH